MYACVSVSCHDNDVPMTRCLDGYSDLGLASGMFFILKDSHQDSSYSHQDVALLAVVMVASVTDLAITMAGVFVPIWGGVRGVLVHLTSLACETSILAVTVTVLQSQLTNGEVVAFTSTTACAPSSFSLTGGLPAHRYANGRHQKTYSYNGKEGLMPADALCAWALSRAS